jgi:rhodanese-related sulfurtransferase/ABC-type phosphate/phosphonate transport system substrate-binding protein
MLFFPSRTLVVLGLLALNGAAGLAQTSAPATAASAPAITKVLINPGDRGEQSRFGVYAAWKSAIEQALKKEKISNATVTLSTDATADLGLTRSKIPDIFVAPAHVIGSAVRYGYTPVLGLDKPVQAVLVAPKDSPVASLAQAKGKKLGLPLQDSVVTYLVRGEVNAANTTIKRHFGSVYETRYQDALLSCLQLRQCDVVAVERSVFDRWAAAGEAVKVVMESKPAPNLGVAIKDGVKPGAAALRSALMAAGDGLGAAGDGAKLAALEAKNFDYVSTLGYFTPRALPGVAVVDAKTVAQMMERGARYVDTRTEAEFKAGRAAGSVLVPYVEKSAKEADFNPALDQFELAPAIPDRNAELIFACNGAECWKSFKASQAAIKAGYTKVHWFRGGFPEWRSAGLKIDAG